MEHKKPSDFPQKSLDLFREYRHGHIDRRSFLDGMRRIAVSGLTVGAVLEMMRPNNAGAQVAKETHTASARLLDQLRTRFTFQISVDVATLQQGLNVASAALAGGVNIIEMGTPLLKNEGVSNVVPAFRKQFPEAILLADMKTMDGGASEARGVYAGGGNIIDFLALAGVDTARAVCAVRDEFRRSGSELPRLAFADILVPHQGPAAQAAEVALRMIEAGVDAVGVHLQSDARRANPKLIESDFLGDMARAIFERVGKAAPVQVVGGLSAARAKSLARAGLRAFVISGNLGQPDAVTRYNLPPAQIEGFIRSFITEVSSPK
jgi:3-keto-L-gulonate-6-phosphate decarboxylase